jgi:outer membrane protein TolC
LVDLAAISRSRAAGASEEAARNDYREARETVALAVSDAYLAVGTAEARLTLTQTDLTTAEAAYQLAKDREAAGLSPEVDALRAQVEQQSRRERVIESRNALAKQRNALLRLVGLDIRQSIRLTSPLTDHSVPIPSRDTAYQRALERRRDYRSASERLRAAQLSKRAVQRERAPRLGLAADYGALGTRPANAAATWNVGVVLRLPLFQGGRISAAVDDADAAVREQQARLRDLRARIAQEVDDALLDVEAARQQVEVSRAAVGYANRALTQSRDRFASGVTNNIELIQAQEALASANEQWVASLEAYDIAQIVLARATGTAEATAGRLLSERE